MFYWCCAAEEALPITQFVDAASDENAAVAAKVGSLMAADANFPAAEPVAADPPKECAVAAKSDAVVAPAPVPAAEDAHADTFKAKLVKNSSSTLGWRLDCVGESSIFIFDVSESTATPVAAYNSSALPGRLLEKGSYIVEINGVTSVQQMVGVIDKSEVLELTIQRASMRNVKVQKNASPLSQTLGLELKYWQAGTSLLIGEIRDGAVRDQGADVKPGDRVLSVNGKSGSVEDLLTAIRGSDLLELEISRCPAILP